MKNIAKYFLCLMLVLVAAVACRDEELQRIPAMDDNIGAITKVMPNPDRTFFNMLNPLENEYVEFTLDVDGFSVTQINSVDLQLIFTEKDRVYDPFQDEFVDSVYAPVILETISSFPATIQISGQEVAAALGFNSVAEFEIGDAFNVTFPINTADGRRLTVALNSELCNQPGQPSFGGCNVAWVVTCESDLGGTFSYTTTNITGDESQGADPAACGASISGNGTLTDLGGGRYRLSDATFGQYGCAWSDSPATGVILNEVCRRVFLTGTDQYGLIYSIEIINVTATDLEINWANDFGDSGTSILTRTDGKEWPIDLFTD